MLRSLATTVVLAGLYYLLPLDHTKNVPVTLVAGLLILAAVTVWQLRVISRGPLRGRGPRPARRPAAHQRADPGPPNSLATHRNLAYWTGKVKNAAPGEPIQEVTGGQRRMVHEQATDQLCPEQARHSATR
ncbi:MAG TPA: hypothetical protein VHY82_05860 [Acetobacteraceae bacterium]|nr:hypothetical protein [Acetobacteraceae bacterium]